MLSRNEVKYIQSLYHKKNRDAESLFVAEGIRLTDELLHAGFAAKKIYALKDWIVIHPEIENIKEVNEAELKRISNFETPNKVFAIFQKKTFSAMPDFKNKITLVLDGIQDPGNLGTIMRTADWFGIENIIASNDTADMYNPKVVQATMGSISRVNIFYTDLKTFLLTNKIIVCGAVLDGANILDIQKFKECFLVIGNESKGIRNEILPFINTKITIPKIGGAESLNAAVATGIILCCLKMKV
ncbi:MAG: RNA methyltransferase [Parafilimonas sp.]